MSAVADARPKHLYHCTNTVTQFRGAVKPDRRARAGRGGTMVVTSGVLGGPPGPCGPRVGALNNRPSNGLNRAPDPDPGGASGAHGAEEAREAPLCHVIGRVRAGVQICCKGPDRAGAMEENRWCSAVLLAADSGPGRLCNRFGQPPAPSCPRSPTRTTAVTPHPHDEQERPVGGAPRCHHAARRGTHPANLRLLRPFPSATLLHPPMYEKKERSGGRGSVAEGKRRSRRLGAPPQAPEPPAVRTVSW